MVSERLCAFWNYGNRRCLSNVTGTCIELPFFNSLKYDEERITSSSDWGLKGKGYLSTQKTSASSQFATMCIRGAGFSADDIHQYQVGEDALAVIRSQVAEVMTGHQSDKLISYLKGLFGVGQKMSGIDGDGNPTFTGILTMAVCVRPITWTLVPV